MVTDRRLWFLLAAGLAVRLALAATTEGLTFDIQSFAIVRHALADSPLDVYGAVGLYRWPYPPGFFPWIELAAGLERVTGVAYLNWVQLAPILADLGIAALVGSFLRGRGARDRVWLGAAALVALGPSFVAISGYAVQIDSVAILPAVAAVVVWERGGAGRAWQAGLLVGVAASIKTVPAVMVLALLPTVRDRREALVLVASAAALPLALLAPFVVADPDGVAVLRRYAGVPGLGGLTLAVQPGLAARWLTHPVGLNGLNHWIAGHTMLVNLVALGGVGAFLARFRVPAPRAAAILWLVVWAFGTGFFFQYLVWGLPFLLLDGHLRAALALQVVATAAAVIFYRGPWEDAGIVAVFATLMVAVWLGWLAGLAALGRSAVAAARAP
ncbi:MAG: hypothetical protein QOI91_910 [Solirubrobacteraceae bacterium]|nr:hypothetical protein [Solirubrobacteraceae bacterium]